jgi:hypothetical protein
LLVKRWLSVRGLALDVGGSRLVRGKQDLPTTGVDSNDLKAILADRESADWHDDASAVLMSLMLLCGLVAAYTPLTPSLLSGLHALGFPYAGSDRATTEPSLLKELGLFALAQLALLFVAAIAWRLLAAAPALLYMAALMVFGLWSLTVHMVAPHLHFFVLMPIMLMTMGWLLKQEITRALRAPGASVYGALGMVGICVVALYLAGTGGYLYGLLRAFFDLLGLLSGGSKSSTEGALTVLLIAFSLITAIWSKKIILALCANDRNPPIVCASAASWTFLMDLATLGLLGLYSRPKPLSDNLNDPQEHPSAEAQQPPPALPDEKPSWSIGDSVNKASNPHKKPKA